MSSICLPLYEAKQIALFNDAPLIRVALAERAEHGKHLLLVMWGASGGTSRDVNYHRPVRTHAMRCEWGYTD